jgi:hypothetical protein
MFTTLLNKINLMCFPAMRWTMATSHKDMGSLYLILYVLVGLIALPSLALLFVLEDYSGASELATHLAANQWCWSYEGNH